MKKFLLTILILAIGFSRYPVSAVPTTQQLIDAYQYATELYQNEKYDQAMSIFKKVAILSGQQPGLCANSLYFYSQCAFRTENYMSCVKALNVLAKRWPDSAAVKNGYVTRFATFVINEVANVQTNWDYLRFKERVDSSGNNVWKESVPAGIKIKRINFKLGFGLLRVLTTLNPGSPEVATAKQKLVTMLSSPITMLWVDEKAPPDQYGHPVDSLSYFSLNEKKDFSKIICERMFFDWQTDRFYMFLNMYDDVRNLKPRFVAKTWYQVPQPGAAPSAPATMTDPLEVYTLAKLFEVSGYNPWNDSYKNVIETTPVDEMSF